MRPYPCAAIAHPRYPPAPSHNGIERMRMRRRAVGAQFVAMTKSLDVWLHGDLSMARLSELAKSVATSKALRIDRLAKRTKEGLICWLCENVPELTLGWAAPTAQCAPPPPRPPPPPPSAPPSVIWPTLQVEETRDAPVGANADADPRTQFPRLAEETAS
jgi:hypothetical protein